MICLISSTGGFWEGIKLAAPILTVSYYILVISLVFLALYILRNSNRSLLGVSAGGGLILTSLILAISYIVPFLPSGVDSVILTGMSVVLLCVVAAFFYVLSHVYFVRHAPPKLLTIGILLPIVPVLIMLGTDYLVAGSYQSVCSDILWGDGRYYVYAYLLWIGLANVYALLYARARSLVKSVTMLDILVLVGSLLFIGILASIVFQSSLHINYILGTLYLLSIGIAYIALSGRSGGSKLVSSGILTPLLVVVLTSFVLIEDLALAKQMVVVACALVLIVGYVLDRLIRTQSEYEQVLRENNSELTQLNKSKNEFLSFATHQLKAPLTAIKWGMGALKDSKLDSNQDMIVSQIIIVANQMVRTVSDFLNSAKLESGQLVLNTAPTDISALAQKIIDEFRPIAKSKKVDIGGVFPKEKIIIDIDESKMEQVFANLVDNALKYTPSGSVILSVEQFDKEVAIAIRDTGAGMAPGEVGILFQKYQRGSAAALNSGGSGIGLYLGKQIVELHGGTLTATSKGKNKGSEFTIRIPSR